MDDDSKTQVLALADTITGLALRIAVPMAALAAVFLLVTAFGDSIRKVDSLSAADKAYFLRTLTYAMNALTVAAIAIVLSVVFRLFSEETLGHVLAIVGAVLYFGAPPFFAMLVVGKVNSAFAQIVNEFRIVGLVCVVPGILLVIRDTAIRVWRITAGRPQSVRDTSGIAKPTTPKFMGACWEIQRCGEGLRKICPAYKVHKSCWRIKAGCFCDVHMLRAARATPGEDAGGGEAAAVAAPQIRWTDAQKRARCRQCVIYSERQNHKYRLLSPMVFATVALAIYWFYAPLSDLIYHFLMKADKLMSFFVYKPGAGSQSSGADGHALTILAIIWIAVIAVSYAQKAVEYLIFKMQV